MESVELTEKQKELARYIYINYRKLHGRQIKQFGLDDYSIRVQIDFWVSVNVPKEGEHYNKIHLYNFSHWITTGFIGNQWADYNQKTITESAMPVEKKDGNKEDSALNLVVDYRGKGEDSLTLLGMLKDERMRNIPPTLCFKRLKIRTWYEFFKRLDDCALSAENIYKRFNLTKWEFVNLSRDINNILAPALRECFPEFVTGDQRRFNFRSGNQRTEGREGKTLQTIVNIMRGYKNRHGKTIGMNKDTIISMTLGPKRNAKNSPEVYEMFERAFSNGLNDGTLKQVKTPRGLDGIALADW